MPQCSYEGCPLTTYEGDPDACGRCILHCPSPDKGHAAFSSTLEARADQHDYRGCVFPKEYGLIFQGAEFTEPVDFRNATFQQGAGVYFSDATFHGEAWPDFSDATFQQRARAEFWQTIFSQEARAYFSRATFYQGAGAYFEGAIFHQGVWVSFREAIFHERAGTYMREATFQGRVDLEDCNFGSGSFTRTIGMEHVTFRRCDLSNVSFLEVPRLEETEFDDVTWAQPSKERRIGGLWVKLTGEDQRAVARDELVAREQVGKENPSTTYPQAARVCNQIRRSYEARRRFVEAGDFYYGEMEMRRLAKGGKIERNLCSVLGWYFHLSGYGQHWRKAAFWLVVFVFAFAFLHSVVGFRVDRPEAPITVGLGWRGWSAFGEGIGECLLYSFRSATLLRDEAFKPLNLTGHVLLAAQNVLGPLLLGLMGLAIRRRFRH